MLAVERCIQGQRGIGEDFTQKKERTGFGMNQHVVFANPTQSGPLRQSALKYRRAVDKCPVVIAADSLVNPFCQRGQAFAHQFVVVAPQGVASNVGPFPVSKHLFRVVRCWQVIQSDGNDPGGPGYQGVGCVTFVAMVGHVGHLAVVTCCQPALQAFSVRPRLRLGNPGIGKAQLPCPTADLCRQVRELCMERF